MGTLGVILRYQGLDPRYQKKVMDSAQETVEKHRGDLKIEMASFKFLLL